MIRLILRNLARNLPKLVPMVVMIALSTALILLGNSIFDASGKGFENLYRSSVTADFGISASDNPDQTIFGNQTLLVGEYYTAPVLLDSSGIRARIAEAYPGAPVAGVVAGIGRLESGGVQQNVIFFGVDFPEYARLFPDIKLWSGSWDRTLAVNTPIVLSRRLAAKFAPAQKPGAVPEFQSSLQPGLQEQTDTQAGPEFQISSYVNDRFAIRAFQFADSVDYGEPDNYLDRLVLIPSSAARDLNGYLASTRPVEHGSVEAALIDAQLEDLLEGTFSTDGDGGFIDPFALFDDLTSDREPELQAVEGLPAAEPVQAAWNWLLVGQTGSSPSLDKSALAAIAGEGVSVRDWRGTVGGSAILLFTLQILFNVGLAFVTVGTLLIAMNSVNLSVLERTAEIGTMRALGATRSRVAFLIGGEVVGLLLLSLVAGLAIGTVLIVLLNASNLELSNNFLRDLFPGGRIAASLSIGLVVAQLTVSVLAALTAASLPLRFALAITPVKALQSR